MKKIMCIALSLAIVLAAVPAFAEGSQSGELEKAIRIAKNVISIPQDYKEFYYSSYHEERDDGKNVTVWNLEWAKTDGSSAINAGVDSLGNLIQYYRYSDRDDSGLAKISREEGRKAAEAFLSKALPASAPDMRAVNERENLAATYGLNYTYQLYKNGIPAPFIQVTLQVNKYSGEVEQFSGLTAGQVIPAFPEADPVYSAEEAAKIYAEELGAQLSYYPYYNYQNKTLTVFAGYAMDQSRSKAIDAITGQVTEIYSDDLYFKTMNAESGAMGGGNEKDAADSGITPEEQNALDNVAGLIGKDKAESIIRQQAGLKSTMKAGRANLNKDTIDQDRYYWRISFDGASGSVDAKTGELLSFSVYSDGAANKKATITQEQAKQKAQAFLEKTAGAKLKLCALKEEREGGTAVYRSIEDNTAAYSFYFQRQEKGVGVSGNGLNVTVNAQTGDITYYDNTWYEKAVFPEIDKAIDPSAAFAAFNKEGNLRLAYMMTAPNTVSLVYDFENSVSNYLIDPFTGGQIDRRGTVYHDGLVPEYSDITGHWAEQTIRSLTENGYYLEGERFEPERRITQEDFLRYLYSTFWSGMDRDDFYQMLERQKIILAGEKAPDKELSRQEAAKYMVRYLGFDKLAQKSAVFKDLFSDKVADGYKGYAAICYGMGIMKGDENGHFNGSAIMTRAEAACALYQLLQAE